MKTSFRFGGLLLAVLFSAVANAGVPAAPAATVYNAKSGLLAGWSSIVWGELTVEPSKTLAKENGGVSLLITPTALAVPYAGLQLVAAEGGGIALSNALRTRGEVHLSLRNGKDASGSPAADQMVQVMLAFQPVGGKMLNGKYEQTVLDPVPADAKATAGWKLVKLSIPQQLQGRVDAATPLKLRGVYVQYIDKPEASYFVGECIVVEPPAK